MSRRRADDTAHVTVRTMDVVSRQSRVAAARDWLYVALAGLAIPALMALTALIAHWRGF